jgi:hypothetical protein
LEKDQSFHKDDCVQYRIATKSSVDGLRTDVGRLASQLKDGLDNAISARDDQHRQNLGALRWQRGLLVTVLLALLGFIGEQAWPRLFH